MGSAVRDSSHSGGTLRSSREADYELRCGVGNPFWPPGRTQVQIHASGSILLTTIVGDSVIRDSAMIDAADAWCVIRASAAALTAMRDKRLPRRLPDEPVYTFEIRRGAESLGGAVWPERLVEAVPQLLRLLEKVREIVGVGRPDRHHV